MKKIIGLSLSLGLLLASFVPATATDIKIKGWFDFAFGWYSNSSSFADTSSDAGAGSEENFDALQRLRLQIDFVASENLSGTLQLEIGDIHWGNGGGDTWGAGDNSAGGALGADGVNVETRHMYIDWIVPETDLSIRMGLLPFALPFFANGAASGNAILDDDMAGVVASYTFNDHVSANLAWLRPWNPFTDADYGEHSAFADHDSVDLIALTIPLTFAESGLEITPWAMYGFIGEVDTEESFAGFDPVTGQALFGPGHYGEIGNGLGGAAGLGQDGKAWWAGISLSLTSWDPFFVAVDAMYGSYSSDDVAAWDYSDPLAPVFLGDYDNDRDGWAVSAMLGYKLERLTPTLFGWYGSGMNDADAENLYDGLMPVLSPDFGFTSFGWSNSFDLFRDGVANGNNITGAWGIGIGLEDIQVVENMSNAIRVAYFAGTNDDDLARLDSFWGRDLGIAGGHLYTTRDWGLEVNLDTGYEIMEGLTLYNQIGYIYVDLDDAWDESHTRHWANDTDDAWEFALGFEYAF